MTFTDIVTNAEAQCKERGLSFDHFQSNHEGLMIDRVHKARTDGTSFIVINAGAWTHTSVALVDALSGINVPFIEVHVRLRYRFEEDGQKVVLTRLPLVSKGYKYTCQRRISSSFLSECQGSWCVDTYSVLVWIFY